MRETRRFCYKVRIYIHRFRANRPISIVSYGFFGPLAEGSQGKYHMDIELLSENFCPIASTTQITSVIKTSEIFHVNFENPVPILPCTWYHAKFSLLVSSNVPRNIRSFYGVHCRSNISILFSGSTDWTESEDPPIFSGPVWWLCQCSLQIWNAGFKPASGN
jgi:hypothetical protein